MTNHLIISYPLISISDNKWNEERLLDYILFDEYIYTDNLKVQQEVKAKTYCDCNGNVFRIIKITPPAEKWRSFFKFVPNVYRHQLHFKKENQRLDLEKLRTYLLDRVSLLNKNGFRDEWLLDLKKAKSHEELINGVTE